MSTRSRAPRVKSKAGYHHGDLRRQLVVATRRLVDRDGAEGFKVADAAALAGVSPAAPYRHFKDRRALLAAVADDGFERLRARSAEASSRHEDGSVEAIRALGAAYIEFARSDPKVFRLMFTPREGGGDGPSSAGKAAYDVLVRHVAAHLGLENDAPPVLGTALSLWVYVHGFASLLIDEQLGVGRMEVDVEAMLRANTSGMLEAFVPPARGTGTDPR